MKIAPQDAALFISGYKDLLVEVYRLSDGDPGLKILDRLSSARDAAVAEPALIDTAAANLEADGRPLPDGVMMAVQSLDLRRWVYLRDTTKYSIFVDVEGKDAYAVLGLTQRLRDVVGGAGVLLRTGVLHYQGTFICDGIVSGPVWLGANYRREYSARLASLKKSGRFHVG